MAIIFFLATLLLGALIFLFLYTAETYTIKATKKSTLTFYALGGIRMTQKFFRNFMKSHNDEVLVISVRGINAIYEISCLAKMIDNSGLIKSEKIKQMYIDVKELEGNYKHLFHLLVTTYLNMDRKC